MFVCQLDFIPNKKWIFCFPGFTDDNDAIAHCMSTSGIGGLPNVEYVDVNPNIDFPACFNSGEEKVAVA